MNKLLRSLIFSILLLFCVNSAYGQFQIVSVSTEPVICNGESNGTITIEISGGIPPYEYYYGGFGGTGTFITSNTSHTFTGVKANQFYQIQVQDATFDVVSDFPVAVTQPAPLNTFIQPDPASICQNTPRQLYGNPMGGNGGYIHEWTPSDVFDGPSNVADPVFLSADIGVHNLVYKVVDQKGCEVSQSFQVEVFATITATVSHTDVSCFQGSNGSITILGVSGGSGSYQYSVTGMPWQSENVFNGLTAGNYQVSVRDAIHPDDCVAPLDPVVILQPASAVGGSTVSKINVLCFGESTGSLTAQGTGGVAPWQYSLNGVDFQASATFENLAAGDYTVTVRDANNCTFAFNDQIIQPPSALGGSITSQTNVSCFNGNDGSVAVAGTGGTPSYQFSIDGVTFQVSGTFENLASGNYTVTVRDANGCTFDIPVIITQPAAALGGSITSQTNVSCFNGNDGSVTVAGSNGTSPYQYSIDGINFQGSGTFENLAAGNYNITVRDALGCTSNISVNITQPATAVTLTINQVIDVSCFGGNDGRIQVSSSGGVNPRRYQINGGALQASGNFTGLVDGNYTITVTDNNGCSVNTAVTVSEPVALGGSIVSQTNVSCFNGSDGSVTVAGNDGTAPYRYSIDGVNFHVSGTFENLLPGDHTITIRDDNECTTTVPVTITQPAAALSASLTSTNITGCFGWSNGTISITDQQGSWAEITGNYEYTVNGWASSSSNPQFTSLPAGTYDVQIRDADNPACVYLINSALVLTQPAPITADIDAVNPVCFGGTGSITFINVLGGTGSYQYSVTGFSTAGQASASFTNLPAGTYDLRIRNISNPACETIINAAFQFTQPEELAASVIKTDVTECNGNDNGEIVITGATGGSGVYHYSVDNGASWSVSNSFTGLEAGNYQVMIRDAAATNCQMHLGSFDILEPVVLFAETLVTGASCFNGANGSIEFFNAAGGTGSYEFSIDGVMWQTDLIFANLSAGNYTALIRDMNHPSCEIDLGLVVVAEPEVISLNIETVVNNDCFGDNGGSLTVSASGGTPGYIYTLFDALDLVETLEPVYPAHAVFGGLAAGTDYRISVTDSRGCDPAEIDNITIAEPAELDITVVLPGHIVCFGGETGSIMITATGGTGTILYSVNGVDFFDNGGSFSNLSVGFYDVAVRDDNGCRTDYGQVELTQMERLSADISAADVTCFGASNGIIEITNPLGGTGSYEYSVNGVDWFVNPLFENLAPGTYEVFIRDAGVTSCFVELDQGPVVIDEPELLEMTVVTVNVDCNGNATGSLEILATGGNGNYQYRLDGGDWQVENIFHGLTAGDYLVEVTDHLGCMVNEPATITEPDVFKFFNILFNDESCFGANDGDIEIIVEGGTPPFRYSIDNGLTFQDERYFGSLAPGFYDIVSVDSAGCSFSYLILIEAAAEIIIDQFDVSAVSCNGAADGSVVAVASGGEGTIMYSLDGISWQASGIFSGLDRGDYTMMFRDSYGCTISEGFTIDEPEIFEFTASHTNVTCFGSADGIVSVIARGGVAPYTYTLYLDGLEHEIIVSDDVTVEFGGLSAGSYRVELSDNNGCMPPASDEMILLEPAELIITSVTHDNLLCAGAGNGTITINATGGTGTIYYSLNNGVDYLDNGGLFTGLDAGTYNVVVRDINGCETVYAIPVELTQPAEIMLTNTDVQDAECFGSDDGSIDVTASGGTGLLEYSLDGIVYQPGGLFSGLSAGEYTIYLRDENSCVAMFSLTVNEPAELVLTANVLNTSCNYDAGDPQIRAQAHGGVAPYVVTLYLSGVEQYSFSGIAENEWVLFEPLIDDMTDYVVTVADVSVCGTVSSGLLSTERPAELLIGTVFSEDALCYGVPEGFIEINADGGSAPFTYILYGSDNTELDQIISSDDARFSDLVPGTYYVTITDVNGCGPVTSDNIIIEQPAELTTESLFISDVDCNGGNSGVISVVSQGGTGTVMYSIDGGINFYPDGNFTEISAGNYELVLRDAAGCQVSIQEIEILEPAILEIVLIEKTDFTIGSVNESGSIRVTEVTGGVEPYNYSIDNGISWQDDEYFDNLDAGTYEIIVRDANLCTDRGSADIVALTGISAEYISVPPSCFGFDDGLVSISGQMGTEPYEYSLNDGADFFGSGNFSGLSSDVYKALVRDGAGLIYRFDIVLEDPPLLGASASVTNTWCRDFSQDGPDGMISLDIIGGTGSYSFEWSNGAVTEDVGRLAAGTYSVTVTDEKLCEISMDVDVGFEHFINISLINEQSICPGSGATLEPVVEQSGMAASYSWSALNGTDPDPVLSPQVFPEISDVYTLRVTDENSCYNEAVTSVNLHTSELLYIGNDTVIFQGTSLELEAKGGEFINYEWTGSGLSSYSGRVTTATPVNETLYQVYAETVNGCIEEASILIGIVQPISPVSGFTPNDDGVNDFFEIPNAQDYPEIVVEIYTRSGQRVFHSNGYTDDKRWDGTFNGKDLPMGTYYFVITLNDIFGTKPVTGPVTIVR